MPPNLSNGAMLWEYLPWESVLKASCPKQRLKVAIAQKTQRSFLSTKPLRRVTRRRRDMFDWLNGPGKVFEQPAEDRTNYLGAYDGYGNLMRAKLRKDGDRGRADSTDLPPERTSDLRPFPLNQQFKSERVLSEEFRELVYQKVTQLNGDITAVSAAYGIDIRRVAAVTRLKAIEKQWLKEGKKLATPYNNAVLSMLPQTPVPQGRRDNLLHEGINDLPVHPATRNQIFYSTSESRQFTREDAAKAFSQHLLPADKRIQHPELIQIEKWSLEGATNQERREKIREAHDIERTRREKAGEKRAAWEEQTTRVVPGKRWDFKFQDISVDSVGPDGRSTSGVGIRYGMPHEDRKRGQYKLPTSVE